MAKAKGPGGERQFVTNSCLECGEEAIPVKVMTGGSGKIQWQCKTNNHLLSTRKYTVTTKK